MTRPMRFFSDPTLASDPDVLPDCEVSHWDGEGWYWWRNYWDSRIEIYPHGPFTSQQAAIDDATAVTALVLAQRAPSSAPAPTPAWPPRWLPDPSRSAWPRRTCGTIPDDAYDSL